MTFSIVFILTIPHIILNYNKHLSLHIGVFFSVQFYSKCAVLKALRAILETDIWSLNYVSFNYEGLFLSIVAKGKCALLNFP